MAALYSVGVPWSQLGNFWFAPRDSELNVYDKPKGFKDVHEINCCDRHLARSTQNQLRTKSLLTCQVQKSISKENDHSIQHWTVQFSLPNPSTQTTSSRKTENELYSNMKTEDGLVYSTS